MKKPTTVWVATTRDRVWRRGAAGAVKGRANLELTGRRDQVWEGFGGCFNELGWIALKALKPADRTRVLDALFDRREGCRFNLCRLPIGASDYGTEWYSHNEHAGDLGMKHFSIARDRGILIPYIREALRRRPDLKLFASPWSPPTWMKSPRAYNYGTMIKDPAILKAYARYFVRFIDAYRREGVRVDQVHVQNEPCADQKFPSCLWTGAEMRDFIRDYLGPAFRNAGLSTEVWLGTLNTDDFAGYPLTVMSDPKAARYVSGIGFQWAGKGAVQRAHASWPSLRLMQTENECGDGANTWEYAMTVFGLFQHYLTNGVNAYIYWNMVLEESGRSTWGWKQNSMVTVDSKRKTFRLTPEFHVMKHFSRFVEPGAVRLDLAGEWAGTSVAFENPDGARVLVVGNPLKQARRLVFGERGAGVSALVPPESFNTFVLG